LGKRGGANAGNPRKQGYQVLDRKRDPNSKYQSPTARSVWKKY